MSYHEAVPYNAYAVAVPKFLALAHAAPVPANQLEHPRSADVLICTLLSVNLQKPASVTAEHRWERSYCGCQF